MLDICKYIKDSKHWKQDENIIIIYKMFKVTYVGKTCLIDLFISIAHKTQMM